MRVRLLYADGQNNVACLCRSMWAEFEWENKVAVNTTLPTVSAFLEHIAASTNMKCLTPPSALVRMPAPGFGAAARG
jgi:hypothetical protein